jgi:transglutaminase-like putative cysteine protease
MKLHVLHRTRFKYGAIVQESFNEARLQPVTTGAQVCHNFILKILPTTRLSHYFDFYLNYVHLFDITQPHSELVVEANSTVTTDDTLPLAAAATPAPLSTMDACARLDRCYDFLQSSTYVDVSPELWRLALDATEGQTDAWQASQAVMRHIHRHFRYQPATTHVHTHMRDVLHDRAGVCQDFAHVMLGLCRALKIPARYVSGYLYNGPTDQLKGAQASHAWVEVYMPEHGWCGLDPTNNRLTDGHYVKVAAGRDYADVSPLKGTYRGTAKRALSVDVLVTQLEEVDVLSPG